MAKILVVDDEPMIRDLLHQVLARHRHEVVVAGNGREAMDLFRRHRPDVTLVDLHMPVMNGLEVLRQIRAIDPVCAVIMLSGEDGAGGLEVQARQLGVTDFVRKGFSLDNLIIATNMAAKRPHPRPKAPMLQGQDGTAILVVDDEDPIRGVVAKYLSRHGYHVHEAKDGLEALELVERMAPDIVLLDMHMPGVSGIDLLRELRRRCYAGKVIVVSASQDEKLLKEALDLGSIDILSKPVDLEQLDLAIQVGLVLNGS